MFKPPLNVQRAETTQRGHDSEIMTVTLSQPVNFQARQVSEARLLVQAGELTLKRSVKTQDITAHTLQVVRGREASEVFAQEYQSAESIAALDENKRKTVLRRGLRLVPLMTLPGHPSAEEVVQAARLMLISEPLDELTRYEGDAFTGAAEALAPAAPEPKKKRGRAEPQSVAESETDITPQPEQLPTPNDTTEAAANTEPDLPF